MDERRVDDEGGRLPKAVGVYDRPRFRRSSRIILVGAGVVVVAIVIVLVILLR